MASPEEPPRPRPGGKAPPCARPGNPVFSCMLPASALVARGFLSAPQLLLYRTTSGEYGAVPPTSATAPCAFRPRDNAFTTRVLACGRAQVDGLNTGVERGRVVDHADLVNTL